MNLSQLPALQVLIPLIGAALCSLIPNRRVAWAFAFLVTAATLACSAELIYMVYSSGPVSYVMGGWTVPFGIEYRIDSLSALFLCLISGIAIYAIIYAFSSVEREIEDFKQPFFYTMYLLLVAGLLGVVASNDIFNIYVFLEIASLASYALIAMGKDRRAASAAFEYLVMGTVGATFILIAIGLIYSVTGQLNITAAAVALGDMINTVPVKMAIAFLTIGLALKIAIFPMHLWVTNAYTHAPSFISSFLSGTGLKVGIYLLIRFVFYLFGVTFSFQTLPLTPILVFLGIAGMLVGSFVAITQDNLKRMLAYSSVAQVGAILLGIGLGNVQGMSAALLLVIFHSIAKASMFMAAGGIMYSIHSVKIDSLSGIGKRMPVTMAVFVISGLSLVGIPGTAGFISKWHLLQASINVGMWPVFVFVLISSALTLIYIWRVIEVAYLAPIDGSKGSIKEAPVMMLIPMVLLSVLSLVLGVWPSYVSGYVDKLAVVLFGG